MEHNYFFKIYNTLKSVLTKNKKKILTFSLIILSIIIIKKKVYDRMVPISEIMNLIRNKEMQSVRFFFHYKEIGISRKRVFAWLFEKFFMWKKIFIIQQSPYK